MQLLASCKTCLMKSDDMPVQSIKTRPIIIESEWVFAFCRIHRKILVVGSKSKSCPATFYATQKCLERPRNVMPIEYSKNHARFFVVLETFSAAFCTIQKCAGRPIKWYATQHCSNHAAQNRQFFLSKRKDLLYWKQTQTRETRLYFVPSAESETIKSHNLPCFNMTSFPTRIQNSSINRAFLLI